MDETGESGKQQANADITGVAGVFAITFPDVRGMLENNLSSIFNISCSPLFRTNSNLRPDRAANQREHFNVELVAFFPIFLGVFDLNWEIFARFSSISSIFTFSPRYRKIPAMPASDYPGRKTAR